MTDWREQAACAGAPTELFFQEGLQGRVGKGSPDPHAEARAYCNRCPVINECLTWALGRSEYGLLGGMTETERESLKRTRQRARQRAQPRDDNGRNFAISPLESERRTAVYNLGLSDTAAAKRLGINRGTYRSWRITNGLKANHPEARCAPLPEWVHELRMSLYKSGLTDRQIAEGAKCTPDAVKNWRGKRGLLPNKQEMVSV